MNLPLCPSYFNIRYPDSITDFKIKRLLSPRLFANWHNFQVTNKITAHRIMLSASVPISLISARRLKRILSQSFCAHVIIAHHDIANPIQLTTPTAQIDPPLKTTNLHGFSINNYHPSLPQKSHKSSRELSRTYQQSAGVITKFTQHLNDNSCEDDKSK